MPVKVIGKPGLRREATFIVPEEDLKNVKNVVIYITVYDVDSDKEAALLVNGHQHVIPQGGDTAYKMQEITVEPGELKPGENLLTFVFLDNCAGTTSGYEVISTVIRLE